MGLYQIFCLHVQLVLLVVQCIVHVHTDTLRIRWCRYSILVQTPFLVVPMRHEKRNYPLSPLRDFAEARFLSKPRLSDVNAKFTDSAQRLLGHFPAVSFRRIAC